uniref:Follistatin-like domain-containing protein n=1 Tax=Trichuris muris TaxID=70415 RepID=A0A5S6QRE2_TRIMR
MAYLPVTIAVNLVIMAVLVQVEESCLTQQKPQEQQPCRMLLKICSPMKCVSAQPATQKPSNCNLGAKCQNGGRAMSRRRTYG